MPRVRMLSLMRDRHAGERARVLVAIDRSSRARERAIGGDARNAFSRGLCSFDACERRRRRLRRAEIVRCATRVADLAGGLKGRCAHLTRFKSLAARGRAPSCGDGSGAFASASALLRPGRGSSATVGRHLRKHVRRRRHAGGVDVLDLLGVFEHVRELMDEEIPFPRRSIRGGRASRCDRHLGACQPLRHAKCYHAETTLRRRGRHA